MILLTVNGSPHEVPESTTIAGLLARMGIDRGRVAVERNLDVVPRRLYDEVVLAAGDQLEIVTFVGGG
jgi:thiamine biosynthesis protein ThiS